MEGDWIKIMDSEDTLTVDLANARLQDAGISSVVLNKKDSAYVVIGRAELYVPKAEVERARELLNEVK